MKTLVVIVGPSGYGKSTLINTIVSSNPTATKLLASTSRGKRSRDEFEAEYQDFNISPEHFQQHADEYFELTQFGSNYYGYSFDAVKNFVKSKYQTAYTFMSAAAFLSVEDDKWSRLYDKDIGVDAFVCVILHSLPEEELYRRLISRQTDDLQKFHCILARDDFDFRRTNARIEDTIERRMQIVDRINSLSIDHVFRYIDIDLTNDRILGDDKQVSITRHCQRIETFLCLISIAHDKNVPSQCYGHWSCPILPNRTLETLMANANSLDVVLIKEKRLSPLDFMSPFSDLAQKCLDDIVKLSAQDIAVLRESFDLDQEPSSSSLDIDANDAATLAANYDKTQQELTEKFGETTRLFYRLIGEMMMNYKKGKKYGLVPNPIVSLAQMAVDVIVILNDRHCSV